MRRRCPTCATPVILASSALRVTRWAPARRTAHARCEALTSVTCSNHHSPVNRSLATPLLPTAQSPLFTARRGIRKPGRDPTGARRLAHCAFYCRHGLPSWVRLRVPLLTSGRVSARSPPPPACSLQQPRRRQWVAIPRRGAAAPWPLSGWGQVPQGPTRLPNVPGDLPPCRGGLSAAHPVGSSLLGEASACAEERGPLLSCTCAASESWQQPRSRMARPPSDRPDTVPASVSELRPGPPGPRVRVCAWPRPGFREDGRDSSVPSPVSSNPSTWVSSAAFRGKLPEWERSRGRQGVRWRRSSSRLWFGSPPRLISGCNVPLAAPRPPDLRR